MVALTRKRAAVVLLGLLGLNCRDSSGPGFAGRLGFAPAFESSRAGIVQFDRVRISLVQPPPSSVTVLDTIIAIPPTEDSIDLTLSVPLASPSADLLLYLRLVNAAGDTVFQNDPYPQRVTVTSGGVPAVVTAPIVYVGVGFDATRVVITTPDTSVLSGDTVQLSAAAFDAQDQIIPGTPIAWRSLDSTRVKVPDPADGKVVGGLQRGPAQIVAELVTGPADTVVVTAQPPATTLIKVSGDSQTAVPVAILPNPLRVRALASDGLGVRTPVAFRAVTPGATVSADTVNSDSLGYAEVTATLGSALGPQTFEARLPGIATPVVFTAVSVSATVVSVTLDRVSDTIGRGATLQYNAVARDAVGLPVNVTIGFTSTVPGVATVDPSGLALGVGAGSTLIIAAAAGHADTAVLDVRALSQVVASPADTVITAVGDSFNIRATAYDNFGQVVTAGFTRTYSSATPSVVTVNPSTGRIGSVGPGNGTIVIRDSVDAALIVQTAAAVRVNQAVNRVINSPSVITIGVDGRSPILATAYDRNGYPIPGRTFGYASRDTRYVTVDSSGVATGVALSLSTYVVDSLIENSTVYMDSTLVQVVSAPPALLRWASESLSINVGDSVLVPLSLSRTDPAPRTVFLTVLPAIDTTVARPALRCDGPVLQRVMIDAQAPGTNVLVCGLKDGRVQLAAKDSSGEYSPDTMVVTVGLVPDTSTRGVVVQMQDTQTFFPTSVAIKAGESVTWQNNSGLAHTTTSDQTGWDQVVNNGESFTRTFATPGSYSYHCRFHAGMVGTVFVNP